MYILQFSYIFIFNDTTTPEIYTLSLHDALPISVRHPVQGRPQVARVVQAGALRRARLRGTDDVGRVHGARRDDGRSEEHTSELQSRLHLVCRLLLEKKNLMAL